MIVRLPDVKIMLVVAVVTVVLVVVVVVVATKKLFNAMKALMSNLEK